MFDRITWVEIAAVLERWGHAEITRILLRFGLEDVAPHDGSPRDVRANRIVRHLIRDGEYLEGPLGGPIMREFIEQLLSREWDTWGPERFEEHNATLVRALSRQGYAVRDGELVASLPEEFEAPTREAELLELLDRFGMGEARGHLEQARRTHTRGEWAAANSQLRSFVESLFDAIAERIGEGDELPARGQPRRRYLARRHPPFFDPALNEWDEERPGFFQGFFRRLHPEGSHPGLSDEADSTFRLLLVELVAHYFLRRVQDWERNGG